MSVFEKIPTVPTSEELLDKAFSRAARARRGKTVRNSKDRVEAEVSMILTAGNILADNLFNIIREFPSLDRLSPFYRDLAEVLVGVDELKINLASIQWAGRKVKEVSRNYVEKIRRSGEPSNIRKMAFGRLSSIIEEIGPSLGFLDEARNKLRELPDVRDEPTIVVAGYPNVGKSSFVAMVSSAKPKIAPYPYTTKGLAIGHFIRDNKRYQIIDTPGLLDRPLSERNKIELQAITALKHVADVVLFMLDPSETCGYSLKEQEHLLGEIKGEFKVPMLVAANKGDLGEWEVGDMTMSTLTGDRVGEILERLLEIKKETAIINSE